jgi:hypothetical protein
MSDTLRRAVAGLAAFAAPFIAAFLSSKGFPVSDAEVVAAEVAAMGYLAQSVTNAIHARSVAAAAQPSPAAAIADLNQGPK